MFDTERAGMPAVVVLNDSALSFAHHGIFPWHLEIVIRAASVGKNGMPTPSEVQALDQLGDALEAALEERTVRGAVNVLFLARITCDSQRELIYRVHDAELADSVLQGAIANLKSRDWSFTMSVDERWAEAEVYHHLAKSVLD
jgi:hypothetical protein